MEPTSSSSGVDSLSEMAFSEAATPARLGHFEAPLRLQGIYLALVVFWNAAGAILIAWGLRAPGPTASLLVILFALFFAAGLIFGSRRLPGLYLGISMLMVIAGAQALVSAWTRDPALWPSDFWRYAGMALNALGSGAGIWGVLAWLAWRRGKAPA